jgi:hypothetical protein
MRNPFWFTCFSELRLEFCRPIGSHDSQMVGFVRQTGANTLRHASF